MRWLALSSMVVGLSLTSCEKDSNDKLDAADAASKQGVGSSSERRPFTGSYSLDFDEIARRHGKIPVEELDTDDGKHRLDDARDMLVPMAGTLTLNLDGTFLMVLTIDGIEEPNRGEWSSEGGVVSLRQPHGDKTLTSTMAQEGEFWVLRDGDNEMALRKN